MYISGLLCGGVKVANTEDRCPGVGFDGFLEPRFFPSVSSTRTKHVDGKALITDCLGWLIWRVWIAQSGVVGLSWPRHSGRLAACGPLRPFTGQQLGSGGGFQPHWRALRETRCERNPRGGNLPDQVPFTRTRRALRHFFSPSPLFICHRRIDGARHHHDT